MCTSSAEYLVSRSLYVQSYAAITHNFVKYITEYQRLQKGYEKLLEKNYSHPSFFEEESPRESDSPSVHVVSCSALQSLIAHENDSAAPARGGVYGEPDAVSSGWSGEWL